jgi:hypothetical protein
MEASVRESPERMVAVLEYANGQSIEVAVSEPLAPGDEFEMYGRRWRAVRLLHEPARIRQGKPSRILCRSTTRLVSFLTDPRD